MTITSEAASAPMALQAALDAGLNSLSNSQTVSFQTYNLSVLPTDGFVFWVKDSSAPVDYVGSVHQITERRQDHDQTISVVKIIFTAESEVTQFASINPQTLLIGTWVIDGVTKRMVFNDQAGLYLRANLFHYSGDMVYPAMESQLVDTIDDLPVGPIVSNSLPIWLTQNTFAPVYPSYLVPANIEPPYIAIHIPPEETQVLAQFPTFGWPGDVGTGPDPLHQLPVSQLMQDKVEITLYGFNNQQAWQYLASLEDYSLSTDDFGFCNSPSIRDAKRIQSELSTIAMKKIITIVASYYQAAADVLARRLILQANCSTSV